MTKCVYVMTALRALLMKVPLVNFEEICMGRERMTVVLTLISTPVLRRVSAFFFFSSRRRHTRFDCDWSSDVCSSDLHADAADCTGRVGVKRVQDARRDIERSAPGEADQGDGGAARRGGEGDNRIRQRSEERRVGEEGRSRWAPYH